MSRIRQHAEAGPLAANIFGPRGRAGGPHGCVRTGALGSFRAPASWPPCVVRLSHSISSARAHSHLFAWTVWISGIQENLAISGRGQAGPRALRGATRRECTDEPGRRPTSATFAEGREEALKWLRRTQRASGRAAGTLRREPSCAGRASRATKMRAALMNRVPDRQRPPAASRPESVPSPFGDRRQSGSGGRAPFALARVKLMILRVIVRRSHATASISTC